MLIFRAYSTSPGSLVEQWSVSSEMVALANDEYAIRWAIPEEIDMISSNYAA